MTTTTLGADLGGKMFCPFPKSWYPAGDPCAEAAGWLAPKPAPAPDGQTPADRAATECAWCRIGQLAILAGLIGLWWYGWQHREAIHAWLKG